MPSCVTAGATLPHSTLRSNQPYEFAGVVVEPGKNCVQIGYAHVFRKHLANDPAKVRLTNRIVRFASAIEMWLWALRRL
jgi:hypothetical protein